MEDGYGGTPHWEAFVQTLAQAPFPVTYNGDIFSLGDLDAFRHAFPDAERVMLGRGIVTNPALGRMAKGGPAVTIEEFKRFHDLLFQGYEEEIGNNAVLRMKEWWSYAMNAFEEPLSIWRAVRKVKKAENYMEAAASFFAQVRLADEPSYRRREGHERNT